MFTVYGRAKCDYCEYAIDLLTAKNLPFEYYDIKSEDNKDKLNFIIDQGFETVPQVFWDEEHIGGYTEVEKHVNAL
ncbi:glutaredoxin domain-containing protein [Alteromonas sp. RKMC-009]|uniref:glutaredoxin domain-containing protein n=1 Tax=Alteromonas sp. RKMC-009 TaxID=2267264 RepID=UPI000E69F65A|nr:glutaredoxin domain-containing protein [Alteromonas sp. RKMC-009]AYA64322.1 glutaredoxin [Alteromonas sp. RKMC-009]